MVNVAILGFGTVGSGVAELISSNSERIAKNAAQEIKLKYILDIRDFPGNPFAEYMIKDFSVIENDPDVQVVVETIGGTKVAYEFTKRALMAGKNVVTSNKELVAVHGQELLQIALKNNLNYLFEASVGGGIPVLRPICQCLAANEIEEVYGILNGTTNYILSKMVKDDTSFKEALAEAQRLGYAEADPTADIEGIDACRKICILSDLSFGRHVDPEAVPTEGISPITLEDTENARLAGYRVKLLGRAVRMEDGKVAAYVAPHLIAEEKLLAGIEDVFNGIVVKGNAVGEVLFYGRGAGKLPTASAVVADVIDAAKHLSARKYVYWEEGGPEYIADPDQLISPWYVRGRFTVAEVKRIFGDVRFIVGESDDTVFITAPMSGADLKQRAENAKVTFRVLD